MIIFVYLIVYILGVIATMWIWYHDLNSGTKVTLGDLIIAITMCMYSWYAFIIYILIVHRNKLITYVNKTIFKKK